MPVICHSVTPDHAVAKFGMGNAFSDYSGLEIKGGECLNVQFTRRREFPW